MAKTAIQQCSIPKTKFVCQVFCLCCTALHLKATTLSLHVAYACCLSLLFIMLLTWILCFVLKFFFFFCLFLTFLHKFVAQTNVLSSASHFSGRGFVSFFKHINKLQTKGIPLLQLFAAYLCGFVAAIGCCCCCCCFCYYIKCLCFYHGLHDIDKNFYLFFFFCALFMHIHTFTP